MHKDQKVTSHGGHRVVQTSSSKSSLLANYREVPVARLAVEGWEAIDRDSRASAFEQT